MADQQSQMTINELVDAVQSAHCVCICVYGVLVCGVCMCVVCGACLVQVCRLRAKLLVSRLPSRRSIKQVPFIVVADLGAWLAVCACVCGVCVCSLCCSGDATDNDEVSASNNEAVEPDADSDTSDGADNDASEEATEQDRADDQDHSSNSGDERSESDNAQSHGSSNTDSYDPHDLHEYGKVLARELKLMRQNKNRILQKLKTMRHDLQTTRHDLATTRNINKVSP